MAQTKRSSGWLVSAMAVAMVLIGCTGGGQSEAAMLEVDRDARAREVHTFDSLDVMLATADAVAVATVVESNAGRVVGEPGAQLAFTEVKLAIDEVLMGRIDSEVVLEVDSRSAWTEPGVQSVFILHQKEDATAQTYYRPLNSQSVFMLSGSSLSAATDDAFAKTVAEQGLAGLRLEIARVTPLIQAGVIRPAETLPRADDASD